MRLKLAQQDRDFQEEVRYFLRENLSEDLKAKTAIQASIRTDPETAGEWARILGKKGLACLYLANNHGRTRLGYRQTLYLRIRMRSRWSPGR